MPKFLDQLNNRLAKYLAPLSVTAGHMNEALYTSWYAPFTPITPPRSYTGDLMLGYMDSEAIYSIVNKIAGTASAVPMKMVTAEGEDIESHWVLDLLENPNPDNTFKELLFNYYVYLLSIGNSFIYSPKLDSGRTTELWTMPSDLVNVMSGPFWEPVYGYRFIEGNQEIMFPKETVMHGKLFNPRFLSGSWVYGLSPIEVAAEVIRALNAGVQRQAMLAETGAPPFIISSETPEGLTPPQQEMLEDTYKKKYTDDGDVSSPMLTGTPVKVQRVGVSSADLELIAASDNGWAILCNIYGVDSILFNDKRASTYNNVEQVREDFYEHTIRSLNLAFAERLKKFLIPNETNRFEFDYSNIAVLQKAFYTKAQTVDALTVLTMDEKREILGYEPMKESDKPTPIEPKDETTEL